MMKTVSRIFVIFFLSIVLSSTAMANIDVSIVWEDGTDSLTDELVVLTGPGIYHFDLKISGINNEQIDEIQFDLINPPGTFFTTFAAPVQGDSIQDWLSLSDFTDFPDEDFRVIASQFLSTYFLTNGTLFSSLEIEIPMDIDSPFSIAFSFANEEGIHKDLIDLHPLTLTSAVPAPSSILLLGMGICSVLGICRKRN